MAERVWGILIQLSHIDNVIKYINEQEAHHSKTTFREEYLNILEKYEVDYDAKYLFEWLD
jgi:hypothetical protein